MKRLICFLLIVLSLFITACNTEKDDKYIKARVSIKRFTDEYDYIYVTEIGDSKVLYNTYYIEYDDKLKAEELRRGDILDIEYKIKEQAIVPIIELKSFKRLIDETYKKMQVIIKNMKANYIYVAAIENGEVTYGMYNIERDDNLKEENLKIGDVLEIEYQVKRRSNPPLIKVKSYKILPQE